VNRSTRRTATSALGVLLLAVAATAGFGLPGLVAAILTAAASAVLGPVYGFALGQLAIAVLVRNSGSELTSNPALVGAEVGLFVLLWSTLVPGRWTDRETLRTGGVAVLGTVGFAVPTWGGLAQTEALWLTGGVLLASIVALSYLLHRYTNVFVRDPTSHE